MDIDISGIDKAELLAALYNEATPVGLGFLHAEIAPMTKEQALAYYREWGPYFDYVKGRPLKVDLGGEMMRVDLYDRDQGHGRAEAIVTRLRSKAAK